MANIKISELNPLLTVEDADVLPIVDNAVTKKVTAAILRSYTQGNSVLLTGAQTVAGIKTFTSQLASSVATGTAPFSVASTTKVTNLNADLLDGLSSADFALSTRTLTAGTGLTGGGDLTANRTFAIDSTVATLTGTQTLTNKTITSPVINEILDSNGNEILGFTPIASATDYITIKNGIGVGVPLHISAAGSSTNTGLHLEPKGTGLVQISDGTDTSKGIRFRSSGSAASAVTLLDAVSSAGRVITLPNATTTLVGTNTTDTLTNKSIAGDTNTLSNIGNASLTNSAITINGTSTSLGGSINVGTVTSVAALTLGTSGTDLTSSVATGTTTPVITLNVPTASASNRGALSSTDWSTFNAKQNAITLTTTGTSGAATLVGSTLNIPNYADTDTGITSLNGLTALTQTFAVGTSGTDFGISSATSTHTFNLPTASAANRGALSSADWTTFNNKASTAALANYLPLAGGTLTGALGGTSASFSQGISADVGSAIASIQVKNASTDAPFIGFYRGGTLRNALQLLTDGSFKLTDASLVANAGLTMGALNGTSGVFSSSVTATQFTADSRTKVGGGYIADMGGAGNDTGIFFGANTILPSNGSGTITTKDLGSATYPWGAATFSADATINGVRVGRGAGNFADNTAVGASALNANTSGLYNTALGNTALGSNSTGSQNVSVGGFAMAQNTTGSLNVALGESAMRLGNTGSSNTAIGTLALYSNTASNNTAVGFEAGKSNTSGEAITAIGFQTLKSNTTGGYNTALGYGVLFANTTGSFNTATGLNSQYNNTTGGSNSSYGVGSLQNNVTGSNNTALGNNSLYSNTASNNTAVGYEAGFSNTSGDISAFGFNAGKLSTGNLNTFIGNYSGYINTTGQNNTFVGYNAGGDGGTDQTTGSNNTAVGTGAVTNNFDGSLILGRDATATANNQFVVGSTTTPAGTIATEVVVSDTTWSVRINGTAYKILLKA